jgi:aryl-alcohol dehydrogenase-like predicted oxidoreductase
VYSAGISEEIVGQALKDRRESVVLATKFFMPMSQDDPNQRGGSRRWIIREVENSLKRLGTEYIDLYQVHRPSADTDISETLGALSDLVRQGKIRYIGSSSYSGSQIVEAQWTSRDRRLERFVTEQPPYSILVRGIEEDVLPTVRRHGMGTLTYSPLAGGWLSGRYRKDSSSGPASAARPQARFDMTSPANQRKLDAVEQLAVLADKSGLTLVELAVAFVIHHPGVTSAIIGPRTMEQLDAFLPAADVTLPAEVLDRIDEIVAPGVTVNPADNSYGDFDLQADQRRR